MTTAEFISFHRKDDVHRLALQSDKFPDVDMPFALSQIDGWQRARSKLPSWAANEGITYPPRRAMEQASSELTARYKHDLARELLPDLLRGQGSAMADLTGGAGVDCAFLAPLFQRAVYVERNAELCDTARKNFSALGLTNIKVVCGDAAEWLSSGQHCDLVYIDPDRRDENGERKYALNDCSPDVTILAATLLRKARLTMVKCSPMLDWHKAAADLAGVKAVHIVSVADECKELLLVLSGLPADNDSLKIVCAADDQRFDFTREEAAAARARIAEPLTAGSPGFLYVPNASVMKAGCFGLLCERFRASMIAPNSHLFVSREAIDGFPGKRFGIQTITSLHGAELRTVLRATDAANIAVRNFPLGSEALRTRLRLRDGGDLFIFGATDSARRHRLIVCRKA